MILLKNLPWGCVQAVSQGCSHLKARLEEEDLPPNLLSCVLSGGLGSSLNIG